MYAGTSPEVCPLSSKLNLSWTGGQTAVSSRDLNRQGRERTRRSGRVLGGNEHKAFHSRLARTVQRALTSLVTVTDSGVAPLITLQPGPPKRRIPQVGFG
jgi:hypothetical protein